MPIACARSPAGRRGPTHITRRVRRLVAADHAEISRALDVGGREDLGVLDAQAAGTARLLVGTDCRLNRVEDDVVRLVADAVGVDLPALGLDQEHGLDSYVIPTAPAKLANSHPPRRSTS